MHSQNYILSVTGSDCMGGVGVQADAKTISDMGGVPLTAITAVTVQDTKSIKSIHFLDTDLIVSQVRTVIEDLHPKAVKVGLVGRAETVVALRKEIIACKSIVLDPGLLTSSGMQMVEAETVHAFVRELIPEATLLMLKCHEAERLLRMSILSDDDMLEASRRLVDMGAKWVLLRGANYTEGQLTALLYGKDEGGGVQSHFFSSYNTEGWQKHGVGGALSTAIATRLGMGDDVPHAISKAHEYIHSQVVYKVTSESPVSRTADIYNQFLSLIADNYYSAHDVHFYADKLCITTRYLNQVTDKVVGKSPKQVIADYLMHEAKVLLESSRMTVQEISDKLGFSSQAMFSTFFKLQEGETPSDFRTRL